MNFSKVEKIEFLFLLVRAKVSNSGSDFLSDEKIVPPLPLGIDLWWIECDFNDLSDMFLAISVSYVWLLNFLI
ncbi:hypothetical protein VYA_26160 [Vibrio alfacsensis]|nr:hypothetical protein VYA_26160 [Vibrio alfacsensis]